MTPSNSRIPQPASILTPATEVGVDQLWKFQIRKENTALLEKLESNEKLIHAIAAENNRKVQEAQERITELEAKVTKIEAEEKKYIQRREKQSEEIATVKAQMKKFRERHTSDGKL
jgi:hypothetical protein